MSTPSRALAMFAPIDLAIETADRAELARLAAALSARVTAVTLRMVEDAHDAAKPADDDLVDAATAAGLLGVSKWFLYQHRKKLPFAIKVGSRTMYSRPLMREWVKKRAGK